MKNCRCLFFLSLSSLILCGCGSASEGSSGDEDALTEAEIFNLWSKGSSSFLSGKNSLFSGAFETNLEEDGVRTSKESQSFGRKGNECYRLSKSFEANEEGKLELSSEETFAVKKVLQGGNLYHKAYRKVTDEEGTSEEGSFISPKAIDENGMFLSFGELAEDFFLSDEKDYDAFVSATKEAVEELYEKEPTVSFKKEAEDAYVLSIRVIGTETVENDDYAWDKEDYDRSFEITVKGEEIVSLSSKETSEQYKKGASLGKRILSNRYEFAFGAFSQDVFDKISVETERTENYYSANVYFVVEGLTYGRTAGALVYEKYDKEAAVSFLKRRVGSFFGGSPVDSSRYESCLGVYEDAAYETPFDRMRVESDEDITLYVKFELPSDLAVVVTGFKENDEIAYNLSFVLEVGDSYDGETTLTSYKMLSLDGKEWKEGDSKTLPLLESRVYLVIYERDAL